MKKQNIVLVGFRGCGKTTFGRALARVTGLPFADLDAEVEFLIGEPISDFVAKHGWQEFREMEQRVAHDFARNFSGIIATGGGTIENSKNLQNLKKTGLFVFLNPNFSDVRAYLLSPENVRPSLNPDLTPAQEIDQMWAQRKDIYAATSEIEVNPDLKGDPEIEAQKILAAIPERLRPDRPSPKKVLILSSSRGSTMQGVFDAQQKGRIPNVEFSGFITDKPQAESLTKAKKAGIARIEVFEAGSLERAAYDQQIMDVIRVIKPDAILLMGWMRILSSQYCEQFGSITVNVHPSLLPKFAGLMGDDVHAKVLEYEEKYTGCTLHRVTAEVDGGETVLQRKTIVDEQDTIESLRHKVQKQEILGFCEYLERR